MLPLLLPAPLAAYRRMLADARAEELPEDALRAVLVANFSQRRMERFGELWRRHGAKFTNDPALRLHHTAWQAAWGPPATLQAVSSRPWIAPTNRVPNRSAKYAGIVANPPPYIVKISIVTP